MSRIAIIQLARHGDIVNVLPICHDLHRQGHEVSVYVHPHFAQILEPVSYVTPVAWPMLHRDVQGAYEHAAKSGFDRVLDLQVDGQFRPPPVRTESFLAEPWARAGYLDRFHDLPLVFDRRDTKGEEWAKNRYLPRTDKPILAYALHGHSSPFMRFAEFERWLRSASGDYQLVDIGKLGLAKVHHLLGLIEAAALLVTIDTLHLHLAYAFGTPTIALHRDDHPSGGSGPWARPINWYWSEPRSHWIGSFSYAQANSPEGRCEIASLLSMPGCWERGTCLRGYREAVARDTSKILHVVDWYVPSTEAESNRNLRAMNNWEQVERTDRNWSNLYFDLRRHASRSSRDLGDTRQLPFLRDVIDLAAEKAEASDILCFTNTDSVLVEDVGSVLRRALYKRGACFSYRVPVRGEVPNAHHRNLVGSPVDPGCDLVAFRASWWRENRERFPDFLIGCDTWDCAYRRIITNSGGYEIKPPVVMHQNHSPFWQRPENIEDNPGQKYNRALYRQWAAENGYGVLGHGFYIPAEE